MAFIEGEISAISAKIQKFKKYKKVVKTGGNIRNLFPDAYSKTVSEDEDFSSTSFNFLEKYAKVVPVVTMAENNNPR